MIDPAICPPQYVEAAVAAIRDAWQVRPRVAIILGSGLGEITGSIETAVELAYCRLPNYPRSTALGHHGRLVCGTLDQLPVVVMDGRFHLYEGYRLSEICVPIAVLRELGAELLIVTNASGGINPRYRSGEIMAIEDHINLMSPGPRANEWQHLATPRMPPRRNNYDPEFIEQAQAIAREQDFVCHRGVYVGVQGPNYETRSEYRAFRKMGGDVVGMSTVPEVIAARQVGLRVLALSMVTNVACPDRPTKTTPEEVNQLAATAIPNLRKIIAGILARQRNEKGHA